MVRSHRFYNYLFSYILLVVLMLIVVSGVVYEAFFDTLRQEAEASAVNALAQIRSTMDMRVGEMNRMALQIAANPLLTPFMVTDGGYGPYKAVEELKKYKSTNMFIRDVILYYNVRDPTQMYAASGTHDIATFFDSIYHYQNWGKADIGETLSSISAPLMRPLEPVIVDRFYSANVATYLYPIPANTSKPYGIVLFLIDEQALRGMAQNVLKNYSGFLYIANDRDEVIFRLASGETDDQAARVWDAVRADEAAPTISSVALDGHKYSVAKLRSELNEWSYVIAMPSEQLLGKVNETKDIFNATVAAVFLLGVAMAVGFSIRHYKPWQKLVGTVSKHNRSEALPARTDEIDFISRAVGEMARETEGLLHRLRSQAGALQEQVLLTLMKGKVKNRKELEELLSLTNVQMDKPHFAVMLFLIDDYGKFHADNTEPMQEILKYSLVKMVEELSQEVGSGYGAELLGDRGIAFLFNVNEGFDDIAYLRDVAVKAKQFFKQYFRQTVTVGIGDIFSDVGNISRSFLQASHAARYRFVQGGDRVICFRDIERDKTREYVYPVELQTQFVRAIKQGNETEAERAVRSAFRLIVDAKVTIEAAECICFDIVNTIVKTLLELNIEVDESIGETLESLFVPHFETIEGLESLVVSFCHEVCRHVNERKESKNVTLLNQMMAYVHEQYTDSTISLERIADRFGLSPSYATRFFHDQTGCSLMRYIDTLRMNKAKALLKDTDWSLKEIMVRVGYLDSTNFIKKFKKAEGITPIHYRNLVREQAQRGHADIAATPKP